MVCLVKQRDAGELTATYEYDGQKRRIEKTVDSDTYDYYYNSGWQLLEVRLNDDTDPQTQYVWDLKYIDTPIVRLYDQNTDGDYADAADNTLYFMADANMNVTALMDASGNVIERYAYDAYGEVTIYEANWAADADNISDVDNNILYAGYHFDAETGLYHVRNRVYHTSLGTFITRDPIGFASGDGMNVYQYVKCSPLHHVDPRGLGAIVGPGIEIKPGGRAVYQPDLDDTHTPEISYNPQEYQRKIEEQVQQYNSPESVRIRKALLAGKNPFPTLKWTDVYYLHSVGTYKYSGMYVGHTAIGCADYKGTLTVFDYTGGKSYNRWGYSGWVRSQSKQCKPRCKFRVEKLHLKMSAQEANTFCARLKKRKNLKWHWHGTGGGKGDNCNSSVLYDMAKTTRIKVPEERASFMGLIVDTYYYNRWGKYTVSWLRNNNYVIGESEETHECIGGGGCSGEKEGGDGK